MATSSDEREAWFYDRVTQEFLKDLRESRVDAMEVWAAQGYVAETGEKTLQYNANALGGVKVLQEVIEKIENHKPDVQPEEA